MLCNSGFADDVTFSLALAVLTLALCCCKYSLILNVFAIDFLYGDCKLCSGGKIYQLLCLVTENHLPAGSVFALSFSDQMFVLV